MNDEIKRIRDGLRAGHYGNTPQGAAEDKAILSGEYAWIMARLEDMVPRKAPAWNKMRQDFKSDTATDRAYDATDDGMNEIILKLRAKGVEKMLNGLGSLINIATKQADNLM